MMSVFPRVPKTLQRSLAALLACALPASVWAADAADPFQFFNEEAKVVTVVSKAEQNIKDVPMAVYVVSNDELHRWGVRNNFELLQRVPGFSFYNTDNYGEFGPIGRGLNSIWRYGFSFELMPIVDWGDMLSLSPNFYKSVEIARGPAGLTWGREAEAGLINFNLRDDLNGPEVDFGIGNSGRATTDVLYGRKFDKEGDDLFVGWHGEQQKSELQPNAFDDPAEQWKVNGINPSYTFISRLQLQPIKVIALVSHTNHVVPNFDHWTGQPAVGSALAAVQGDIHDQTELTAYRGEYHFPLSTEGFKLYLYTDYYRKLFWLDGDQDDSQQKRDLGFNGEWKTLDDKLDVIFGGDLWGEELVSAPSFSSAFADAFKVGVSTAPQLEANYTYRNVYVQTEYALLDSLKVVAGGRVDYQKNAPSYTTLYDGPRSGLIYSPSEPWTFKYFYDRTHRRPTANELSATTQDVSPEKLQSHELIASYSDRRRSADVTLYTQELRDKLTWDGANYVNRGESRSTGVEWAIKYIPIPEWLAYWNGSFQNAKVAEAFADGVNISDPHNADGTPYFVPQTTSFIGTEARVLEWLKVNVDLRSILGIPYQDVNGLNQTAGAHFVDLTLRTTKLWTRYEFSFNVLNLLDRQSRLPAYGEHSANSPGTLAPEGRRYFGTVTVTF